MWISDATINAMLNHTWTATHWSLSCPQIAQDVSRAIRQVGAKNRTKPVTAINTNEKPVKTETNALRLNGSLVLLLMLLSPFQERFFWQRCSWAIKYAVVLKPYVKRMSKTLPAVISTTFLELQRSRRSLCFLGQLRIDIPESSAPSSSPMTLSISWLLLITVNISNRIILKDALLFISS